ncbi:MAG: primosomal protein N' [Candidatus Egerieousia sp.]|nr:primosomal protein N' [Candidatus Egerieousia sp.]
MSVILPVKFKEEVLYLLPDSFLHSNSSASATETAAATETTAENETTAATGTTAATETTAENETTAATENAAGECKVAPGTRVRVHFGKREMIGVVRGFRYADRGEVPLERLGKPLEYKEIDGVVELPAIKREQLEFWQLLADYYLCTVGEVYKAAYPALAVRQESVKSRKSPELFLERISFSPEGISQHAEGHPEQQRADGHPEQHRADGHSAPLGTAPLGTEPQLLPMLSQRQQGAFDEIRAHFGSGKRPVLLHGATGSGKTEIYVKLAQEVLAKGKNVLYMVPEIALSKELESRLKGYFGERLLLFHSKVTAAQKHFVHSVVLQAGGNSPVVVLGTRSSLFLPFAQLGLVIVDEEHDPSYKQSDPAPRYNARDAAVLLASIYGAHLVMGSATPSFESLYNVSIKKYARVMLPFRYFGAPAPDVEIIDTIKARRVGEMKGSFSQKLINALKENMEQGGQALVFRNRRSYSPMVQCDNCGQIPKCPHCNVSLSYHRYNNTLRCHYCDYTSLFSSRCPQCSSGELVARGAGTERVEEELRELLPLARIERFDADVAESKREEERIISSFAKGEIDILVGTQMLSKGFDFEKLSLVALLQADTVLGMEDFRADERALQLFTQLIGRSGRRGIRGKMLIQSAQKNHPIFKIFKLDTLFPDSSALLDERREFRFAPYVRMVKITLRHRTMEELERLTAAVAAIQVPCLEITGPFVPGLERLRGEWQRAFYVKFARDSRLSHNKRVLMERLEALNAPNSIVVDVDPY